MKKVIAIMLSLTLLTCTASAFGIMASDAPAGTPVSTVEEFIAMDPSGVYYLANDIDFTGGSYTKYLYSKEFKGVLDGNGHSLTGITINGTNSDAGIFANWFAGTLKNIIIGSEDAPIAVSSTGAGYSVAAIAGTMKAGAKLDGVVVYANVKGDGKTSGISSYLQSGNVTVENCAVYGTITGNPAAGFFALSNDSSANVTIRNSYNYATVTAGNSSAGGFYTIVANVNGGRSGSLTVTGCVNFGAITATDWRCGGIVGEYHENKESTLKVDYCYNMGKITMKGGGGFACGIVGGASFDPPTGKREITNVYNAGEIVNTVSASNAYAIAFSNHQTDKATVKNAAYLSGKAALNVVTDASVKLVADKAALLETVSAYPASAEGNRFVEDTTGINDGYPILAREVVIHENIKEYACGRRVCLDCGKVLSKASEEKHTYTDAETRPDGYLDGIITSTCSACGTVTVKAGKPSAHRPNVKDGVYEIGTLENLKWYQANLEAGRLNGRESLVLTADIDCKNETLLPIGSDAHPFGGKLDGAMHTVHSFRIKTDKDGGLFGKLTMGAAITKLALSDATVEAKGAAGALFGTVSSGAIAKVSWIAVSKVTVTSETDGAGAVGGSSNYASEFSIAQCAVSDSTVNGKYAGGVIGNGNGTVMANCFVNAAIEGSTADGALAYYAGNFSQSYSGYVRNGSYNRTDGMQLTAERFAAGEAAYLINTYANERLFGCENGIIGFGTPTYMVRYGEEMAFTNTLLTDNGSLQVYTDGKTVAVVLKRVSGPRLTDTPIKLTAGGKTVEVKVSDMTLTRRVTLGNTLYTVPAESALYVISLDNVTAYTVGDISGNAVTK